MNKIDRRQGFDFENIYTDMVNKYDNAVFVEIGAYEGGSTKYMAELIKNSGKTIQFYTVDIFEDFKPTNAQGVPMYRNFIRNMGSLINYVTVLKMDSVEASKLFSDASCDFIFIDADHTYEKVKRDIESWLPKIKATGTFAGHDYIDLFPGVSKAVNEIGFSFYINKTSWVKK